MNTQLLPEHAPMLSDQMLERLGQFYEAHYDRLSPVPFGKFVWDPLGWCRWAGVSDSPYRWHALPEPPAPSERRRWWHFGFTSMELLTIVVCILCAALVLSGLIHGG
jgi:hypothetical protein